VKVEPKQLVLLLSKLIKLLIIKTVFEGNTFSRCIYIYTF